MKSSNGFPIILVLMALSGVAGCAATDTHEGTGGYVDDATVTTKVKSVLLDTHGVDSTEISVETFKGVVKLSGFVDSKTMIDTAVNAAETVNGVKSVTDDMTVKGQQGPR